MRVYIAGSFVDQEALRPEADKLWKLGHEVTGTWLHEVKKPEGMSQGTFWKKLAIKDLCEVARADVIVLDNRRSSGGKNTEWGYGLGQFQHKALVLIGEPSTVFHELADLQFDSWEDFFIYITPLEGEDEHALV